MHLLLVVQLHLLQAFAVGDVMVTGTQELLITEIASDTACTVIAFDRQTAPAAASGAALHVERETYCSWFRCQYR